MLESTLESGTWFQSDKEPSKWAARDGPGRRLNLPLGHRGCGFCCPPLPREEAVAFRHHLHSLQMKELAEGETASAHWTLGVTAGRSWSHKHHPRVTWL